MEEKTIVTDAKVVSDSAETLEASYTPSTPVSLKEVGLNRDMLIHLFVKILY